MTISLVESSVTEMGLGNWSQRTGLPDPPASVPRYRVEYVSAKHPGDAPETSWSYVPGSPAMMFEIGAGSTGWTEPVPPIADVFDRYIELARRNLVGETPTFAQALQASSTLWPPHVTVGGTELSTADTRRIMPLLEQIEPVYCGVQGHMLGGRDLHKTELSIGFGTHDVTFAYVASGPVAPYALLFPPGAVGGWDYVQILDPPGYAQLAYTVPLALETVMSDRGYGATALQEIVSPRTVPLLDVVREGGIDHIEVWQGSETRLIEQISSTDVCSRYPNEAPRPAGAPAMNVAVWWRGMQPFPEAVRPASYSYYSPAANTGGRGVLVETQPGAVYDSGPGPLQAPCYAASEVDTLLGGATGRTGTSPTVAVKRRTGGSAIVAPLLVVGLTLGFLVAWRGIRPRRPRRAR